jgi:hypothetical protein
LKYAIPIYDILQAFQTLDNHTVRSQAKAFALCYPSSRPKEYAVREPNLPSHIVQKFEQRWAARLAGEAAAWRSERPMRPAQKTVVSRKGRLVPVTIKNKQCGALAE